jgi:hypothetical protein
MICIAGCEASDCRDSTSRDPSDEADFQDSDQVVRGNETQNKTLERAPSKKEKTEEEIR